jgi:hypothetical protein
VSAKLAQILAAAGAFVNHHLKSLLKNRPAAALKPLEFGH